MCISHTGGGGSGKIQVEFETICRKLRLKVLEDVVRERWGDQGVRIVRMLLQFGKMDEKHVSIVSLSRFVCTTYISFCRTDCQSGYDVSQRCSTAALWPIICLSHFLTRSSERRRSEPAADILSLVRVLQPGHLLRRSHHLSRPRHIELQKTYANLLGSLYKTLGNILSHTLSLSTPTSEASTLTIAGGPSSQHTTTSSSTNHQATLVAAVLAKKARTDVSQDEDGLLSRTEKEIVRDWEQSREKLGVLSARVDEAVFVLRDLGRIDAEG